MLGQAPVGDVKLGNQEDEATRKFGGGTRLSGGLVFLTRARKFPRARKSGRQTSLPAQVKGPQTFLSSELALLSSTLLLTRWLERNQPGAVQKNTGSGIRQTGPNPTSVATGSHG